MTTDTRPRTKVQQAIEVLDRRAEAGVTWRELGWPHGSASRVLSDLHRIGTAVRLTERRDGCSVYVLPEHTRDRDTVPQGRVTLADQALAAALGDSTVLADRVEAVILDYQLDSRSVVLALDLRRAIGRTRPTDPTTLPLPEMAAHDD